MKYLLASLSIAITTSGLAMAAPTETAVSQPAIPPQKLELARQFVALTLSADDYVKMMRASAMSMAEALSETLGDGSEDPAADEKMQRTFEQIEPKVRAHLPKLADAYSRAYARAYSEAELLELIAFAQSSAGKRYMTGDDGFTEDPAVREAQDEMMGEIQPIIEGMRKEACVERAKERLAAGDAKAKCPLSEESETLSS